MPGYHSPDSPETQRAIAATKAKAARMIKAAEALEGDDSATAKQIEADRDATIEHLEEYGLPLIDYKGLGESYMSRLDKK